MQTLLNKKHIHYKRKLAHAITGISLAYTLYSQYFTEQFVFYAVSSIAALGVGIDFLRIKYPNFNQNLLNFFQHLARDEERNSLSGMTTYFLGTAICLSFTESRVLAALLLVVAVADPMASIVGLNINSKKLYQNKSLAGFCAFLICSLILLTLMGWSLSMVLAFSLALALAETFIPLDDNLTIPLTGCVFYLFV